MTQEEQVTAGHTPGPWVENGSSDWYPERWDGPGNKSWTVIRSDSADYDVAIVMHAGRHDDPVLDANARLIAAAPEMLAELRHASWLLADLSPDGLVKRQIDAVIRKATGKA